MFEADAPARDLFAFEDDVEEEEEGLDEEPSEDDLEEDEEPADIEEESAY